MGGGGSALELLVELIRQKDCLHTFLIGTLLGGSLFLVPHQTNGRRHQKVANDETRYETLPHNFLLRHSDVRLWYHNFHIMVCFILKKQHPPETSASGG
jgi:hypothetical protein